MDEFEDLVHPTATNDEVINNHLANSQQNIMTVQNLVKDVAIIKRNLSRKSIIRDNDISDNE